MTDTKLNDQELAVLDQLGLAAKMFSKLDIIHRSDASDFTYAIHLAQNIVLARAGMRQYQELHGFSYTQIKSAKLPE